MTWSAQPNIREGFRWRCRTKVEGATCSESGSIKHGSWLQKSNLIFQEILLITYDIVRREHAQQIQRCIKLIHSLSKSAKISWGHKQEALKTIYKGAILPLLLYGAPVWIETMEYEYNRLKYIRVQRLTNIRIAKAFRTTSSEALCILAGMTPIIIKTEEAVKQNNIRKGK